MTSQALWRFNEENPWVRKDPVEEEFFTPEGHSDALVREAIQNSLDAALAEDKQVTVRFFFSGASAALPLSQASRFLDGLVPHLEAPENLPALESGGWTAERPMEFLAIEDFATRGLVGDPSASSHAIGGKPNDFYYFFRNVGRSGKSATDRGRWGLGKTVFPAASSIRAFFGYTVRDEDPSGLLMGQAVLKSHLLGQKLFDSYGFFGLFDGRMPQPIEDEVFRTDFKKSFGLMRSGGQTGLSVVVPFPLRSVTSDAVLRSVISHYFFAVLGTRLSVRVEVAGAAPTFINAATIGAIASKMDWSGKSTNRRLPFKPPFDLAEWALGVGDAQRVTVTLPPNAGAPRWSESLFQPEQLATLRSAWSRSERLAIRVALSVHPKKQQPQPTSFDVYLERDAQLARAEDHYVRGGMAISGIRILKEPGVRGLVVVSDPALSKLLGDAENPAHTEWPERGTRVSQRYDLGPTTVSFVKRSLEALVRIVSTPEKEVEKNLLRDVFFVQPPSLPADSTPDKARGRKKGSEPTSPPTIALPRTPSAFNVEPRQGGFVIRGNADVPLPERLRIEAAFDVRSGDPFKAYDRFDFDFADPKPIQLEVRGGELSNRRENRLEFTPTSPDFELVASGFDLQRDLKLKVRSISKAGEALE